MQAMVFPRLLYGMLDFEELGFQKMMLLKFGVGETLMKIQQIAKKTWIIELQKKIKPEFLFKAQIIYFGHIMQRSNFLRKSTV